VRKDRKMMLFRSRGKKEKQRRIRSSLRLRCARISQKKDTVHTAKSADSPTDPDKWYKLASPKASEQKDAMDSGHKDSANTECDASLLMNIRSGQ